MLVEQIWTANAGRNFNYLIACPETGEALAVDPLEKLGYMADGTPFETFLANLFRDAMRALESELARSG